MMITEKNEKIIKQKLKAKPVILEVYLLNNFIELIN